jgi:hypothetical protein
VGLAVRDKASLGEDSLGSHVLVRGPRTQLAYAVLRCRQPAELPHACRCEASARDSLRDPIADLGGVVLDVAAK